MNDIDAFARGRRVVAFVQRPWNISTQPLQTSRVASPSAPAILISAGTILKLVLLAAALLLLPAGTAFAATINVDATCTLAQAINEANGATTEVGSCEAGADGSDATGMDIIVLSADATVTEQLPEITTHVTIRGGASVRGFAIELSRASHIETSAESNLTLEYTTLRRGGALNNIKAALELGGPATLTQVHVQNSTRMGIRTTGEGAVYSFTNILIDGIRGSWSLPSAIWVEKGQVTITNLGINTITGGRAMIEVSRGAELTLEGCKTIGRVINRTIMESGTFSDNSTGECSGQIGNGGAIAARVVENPPPSYACGFPNPGGGWVNVPDDAGLLEFELSGDCVLTGIVYIPSGVKMEIRSPARQRYSITAAANNAVIVTGGELTLNNVELIASAGDTVETHIIVQVSPPGTLVMRHSIIRRPEGATVARAGVRLASVEATFDLVAFINLASSRDWLASAILAEGSSKVTLRDTTFTGNTGGPGAISIRHDVGGSLRLLGANQFERNTPVGIYDPHRLCISPGCPHWAPPRTPTPPPTPIPTPTPRACPSPRDSAEFGLIGSAQWRSHYARLGIQAQANQAEWARGDAGVSGINYCFWDYDCSTDAHWAYGAYQATEGHTHFAPGTRPPAAGDRGFDGRFNLCFSAWRNGCNSAEAWDFGFASGKQIYDSWFIWHREATSGCELD